MKKSLEQVAGTREKTPLAGQKEHQNISSRFSFLYLNQTETILEMKKGTSYRIRLAVPVSFFYHHTS